MTAKEIRDAASLVDNMQYSDVELDNIIEATELALSYLEGRGQYFGVVITHLRTDLENFERFKYHRISELYSRLSGE